MHFYAFNPAFSGFPVLLAVSGWFLDEFVRAVIERPLEQRSGAQNVAGGTIFEIHLIREIIAPL